ncbi:sentrin-specific protease 1-like [Chrysoperla carnea]|uniref:sentrin-specific protease 1-like n=1 Tax=Chrysoperla carnea TaxID=189513 RepID=UPI001D0906EC|nr:sentrin-specific protease 1-like [Chrysoperla carnea]
MDILNYIRNLFSWAGVDEQPRKRRADFEYDSTYLHKFRRTEELRSPSQFHERIIPIQMSASRDKTRFRRTEKPRPPARWDTKENCIEISDDEEDVIRIDDDHISPQSFYNKSRNENRFLDHDRNQKDAASIEDDDDDVLYVTCIESNEAKAKRLGFKFFKSKDCNKSPIVIKSDSLLRPNFNRYKIAKNTLRSRNESYRLDDKLKYQELLRKMSSSCFGNITKTSSTRNSTLWDIPLSNIDSRNRSRKLVDSVLTKRDTPLIDLTTGNLESKRFDSTENDLESRRLSTSFSKFKADISHNSSLFSKPTIETNNFEVSKSIKNNGDAQTSLESTPKESSPLTVKDSSDSEIECVAAEPASPSSNYSFSKSNSLKSAVETSPFCTEKWIRELKEKHNLAIKEKQSRIEQQKRLKDITSEHNKKIFGANLEERIRRSLIISDPIEIIEDTSEVSFPVLTSEQEEQINRALGPGPGSQVLAQKFNMNITRRDLQSLSGLNWLNDEVINFYMNLIMERGKQEGKLKVYATNTFFYPKLMQGGHQSLRRWTKKVDVFAHDIMLIPVHLDVHWCMTIIDFRDKTIRYLDSMGGHNHRAVEAFLTYLVEERWDKKKEKFDTTGWKMPEAKNNIPQQMNGSDCGMFSCTFAEFYARDAKFNFSQENMPYLRRKMVYEIISGKLLMN